MRNRNIDFYLICVACSLLIACGDETAAQSKIEICSEITCNVSDESTETDANSDSEIDSDIDSESAETDANSDSENDSDDSSGTIETDTNSDSEIDSDAGSGAVETNTNSDSENDSDIDSDDSSGTTETDTNSDSDVDSDIDSDVGSGTTETDTNSDSDVAIQKSCKRGVAYGYHSKADMTALSTGISWWYNWSFTPDDGVSSVYQDLGVEYVAMYWGDNYDAFTIEGGIPNTVEVLLGFNEPNFYSQANLSATDVADLWPSVENIADNKSLYLLSPAVNYCDDGCYDTDPIDYLNDFFEACTDCRVDAIAMHIYVACDESSAGLADNKAQWLINHVENYKATFNKPLWLTEFACSGSPTIEEQTAFLEDAVEYLENEPQIHRYAWFAGRADNMVNVDLLADDGELSELGEAYIHAPYNTDNCD